MKIKLIIDFSNKESLKIINFLQEYRKTHDDLNVDIQGIDINKDNKFFLTYQAMHYADKYGVALPYLHRLLNDYYNNGLDITSLQVLANDYQAIGYSRNNMIDALMEGEFDTLQEYLQARFDKENIHDHCNIYVYDDDVKSCFHDTGSLINYLENK